MVKARHITCAGPHAARIHGVLRGNRRGRRTHRSDDLSIAHRTQSAAFNKLADSIFNLLALFFRFSETRHLGEYSKHKDFGFWKLSLWDHIAMHPFLNFCSIFKLN